ncbi:hypothetical protein RIR_jg4117.t1 [Rhizophagus irregularis DAOM 181602=DAOM 197198]|uniref:Uncharacterized protein n=1 Tax=Rhizophagus irregularis (strain DAOM 181602 / DAOM 197198 / MUCL 43194) TaxID=747089 RepID=U9UE16_RHIID|nr:hypothetical protein RIR_jg4117.t1 [Rhizophagus irregularis DAOM 181602=DAOM 197198]
MKATGDTRNSIIGGWVFLCLVQLMVDSLLSFRSVTIHYILNWDFGSNLNLLSFPDISQNENDFNACNIRFVTLQIVIFNSDRFIILTNSTSLPKIAQFLDV